MAHNEEPMDVDIISSDFDNKENSIHHSNVFNRVSCTEKGYEELDVSELNMKLRYSLTPASSPMSKSYTSNCVDSKTSEIDDDLLNANLTRSFNTTLNKNDSVLKSLPLQPIDTEKVSDKIHNALFRTSESSVPADVAKITITDHNTVDENLSNSSTTSSACHTPLPTSPTKDLTKIDSGSPIMRGLKTVLSMFRSSQSPVPPNDTLEVADKDMSKHSDIDCSDKNLTQAVLASTPIVVNKNKDNLSKRSSPLKESVVFNEDLEKELQWTEDTIIFKHEKIPIEKLFKQPLPSLPLPKNNTKLPNIQTKELNTTVEYMDISYNDSDIKDLTMTDTHNHSNIVESDGEFLDCETTIIEEATEAHSNELIYEEDDVKVPINQNILEGHQDAINNENLDLNMLNRSEIESSFTSNKTLDVVIDDSNNVQLEVLPKVSEFSSCAKIIDNPCIIKENINVATTQTLIEEIKKPIEDKLVIIEEKMDSSLKVSICEQESNKNNIDYSNPSEKSELQNLHIKTEFTAEHSLSSISLREECLSHQKENLISHQDKIISHQEQNLSHQEGNLSHQEENLSHQEQNLPHQEENLPHPEKNLSHQEEYLSQEKNLSHQDENILVSHQEGNLFVSHQEQNITASLQEKDIPGLHQVENLSISHKGELQSTSCLDENLSTFHQDENPSVSTQESTKSDIGVVNIPFQLENTNLFEDELMFESHNIVDKSTDYFLEAMNNIVNNENVMSLDQDKLLNQPLNSNMTLTDINCKTTQDSPITENIKSEAYDHNKTQTVIETSSSTKTENINTLDSMICNHISKSDQETSDNIVKRVPNLNRQGLILNNEDKQQLPNKEICSSDLDDCLLEKIPSTDNENQFQTESLKTVPSFADPLPVNESIICQKTSSLENKVDQFNFAIPDIKIQKNKSVDPFDDQLEKNLKQEAITIVDDIIADVISNIELIKHQTMVHKTNVSDKLNIDIIETNLTSNANIPTEEICVISETHTLNNSDLKSSAFEQLNASKISQSDFTIKTGLDNETLNFISNDKLSIDTTVNTNEIGILEALNELSTNNIEVKPDMMSAVSLDKSIEQKLNETQSIKDNKDNEKLNESLTKKVLQENFDEEVLLSENNSPYVSIAGNVNEHNEQKEHQINTEIPTPENIQSPPSSPKIISKGYNFNFDEIDDPFATKTKIRMSPTPDSPQQCYNTPKEKADASINLHKNNCKSQPIKKRQVLPKKNFNKTFSGSVKDKSLVKNVETRVSEDVKNNTNIGERFDTESIKICKEPENIIGSENCVKPAVEMDKHIKSEDLDIIDIKTATSSEVLMTEANKSVSSSDQQSSEQQVLSSDESVYHSAATSSNENSQLAANAFKNVFNIPEIDNSIFNPFATKSNLRQSPILQNESIDIRYDNNFDINIRNKDNEIEVLENQENADVNSTLSSKASDDKDVTVRELHTDDEDTIEGPFLDNTNTFDKMSNFGTNEDEMVFPTQNDDNMDGELFIDAEAFEFLLNQNKNNDVADNGKESLFLKFDPLFAKRVSSDGVLAALKEAKKIQSTPIKISEEKQLDSTFDVPIAGPSFLNARQEVNANVNVDDSLDFNVTATKPMMAVTPAVSSIVTPRQKSVTPTSVNRRSITFTSPAIAVIDRLLSMSGNNSFIGHDTTITHTSREQNEADIALTQLRELLAEKEIHVYNLRTETKELKDRLTTLELQMHTLETESKERLKSIDELNEKLTEKTKVNRSMAAVVEEYERTIASLIAETEQDKKRNNEERIRLIKERDEQTAHLASMEVSFNDLHSKYEKSKQIILTCKANEDAYKKSIKEFEENLSKMQANYESLKQHATSKLNHANQELEKMNRTHESEVIKLNAMIKRKDLHITSLEETLAQKTKANEELTAICDELINKVG